MPRRRQRQTSVLGVLFRLVLVLVVLGGIGLVGYAYVGDLTPPQGMVERVVPIDAE